MVRELPRILLWHRRVFTGYSARVKGFTPYPDGIIRLQASSSSEDGRAARMSFWLYVLQRLVVLVPTLLCVSLFTFGSSSSCPGTRRWPSPAREHDPAVRRGDSREISPDRPMPVQYGIWIGNVLRGDFGESLRNRIPVAELIASKLPVTIELALCLNADRAPDRHSRGHRVGRSQGHPARRRRELPGPLGALGAGTSARIMLILLFAVRLGWLPASGYVPPWESLGRNLTTIALPSFVLGTGVAGVLMRHTRSAMLQTLDADYVRTAAGEGRAGTGGRAEARAPQRPHPGHHLGAIEFRAAALRRGADGADLCDPGLRQAPRDGVFNRDYAVVQGGGPRLGEPLRCCSTCSPTSSTFLVNPAPRMSASASLAIPPWWTGGVTGRLKWLARRPAAIIASLVVTLFVAGAARSAVAGAVQSERAPLRRHPQASVRRLLARHRRGRRDVLSRLIWGARASLLAGVNPGPPSR